MSCEHILYVTSEEVGCLKSKTRLRLTYNKVKNFFKLVEPTLKHPMKHPRPPDHRLPLTQPISRSLSLTLLLQLFKKKNSIIK